MITGFVNIEFEPIIPLSIRRADGKVFRQDAIVDTGLNGWLSLPPDLSSPRLGTLLFKTSRKYC
jgi:predicted aspartyl protease